MFPRLRFITSQLPPFEAIDRTTVPSAGKTSDEEINGQWLQLRLGILIILLLEVGVGEARRQGGHRDGTGLKRF